LFDASLIVLGYDNVSAAAEPIINLNLGADDDELDRVTCLAIMKKLQPAFQVRISVRLRGLIVPDINGNGNPWTNMLPIKRFRPILQEWAARQEWY
jgi:hypothetical protein